MDFFLPDSHKKKNFINKLKDRELGYPPCSKKSVLQTNIFESNREQSLYQRDVKGHTGCLNAIEFSPNEDFLVSGGDDCSVKIWSTASCCVYSDPEPVCSMNEKHLSNIFTLQFSHFTEKIYSAGNDYRLLVHDIETRNKIRTYKADGSYYRISNHPVSDDVISAACDDGNVYIYDFREDSNCGSKISFDGTAYSVDYNPINSYLLAVCSSPEGLSIYDIRKMNEHYARAGVFSKHAICAAWNPVGDSIFCIRSKFSPLLFNLNNSEYIELRDSEYSNLCTVKSNTFAGSNYVATGSDDWNIYIWKVPENWDETKDINDAYTVLKGHRSIVNHVRYSEKNDMLVSCGVEKIIKCWSTHELSGSYRNPPRRSQFFRTILIGGASPPHESIEEDLETLQQFDNYYLQAISTQNLHSSNSFSSDDSTSFPPLYSIYGFDSSEDDNFFANEEMFSDSNQSSTDTESNADDVEVSIFEA